jgi:hypothetical protein
MTDLKGSKRKIFKKYNLIVILALFIICIAAIINNAWSMEFFYADCKPNCVPSDFINPVVSGQIIELGDNTVVKATVVSPNSLWKEIIGTNVINSVTWPS